MNVFYMLTSTTVTVEEETINSYGISCVDRNVEQQSIQDISCDKEYVEGIIKTFNELQLAKEHFEDAVDDILY